MLQNTYIQNYNLDQITHRYANTMTDRRIAVLNITTKHQKYFVRNRPYQFANFGLILITSGKCEITINLEPTIVKKDDLLVVLSNQFFEIKNFTQDFTVKTLFVDSALFLEAGFHLKSTNLMGFFSSSHAKVISLDRQIAFILKYNLKRIAHLSFFNKNIFAKELILTYFSTLIYEIADFYNKQVKQSDNTKLIRKESLSKDFLLLVAKHFKTQKRVDFYADHLYISRKHLTKIITEVFKKTPKQILIETLILEAKILLKNPNNSINDVVSELNFTDNSVFSKFFKLHTGRSPREYKNEN
ncbi:helix-turn-helix domain-containing protein [Myroides sp. LJL119]